MPQPYAIHFKSDGSVERSGEGQPSLMMMLLAGRVQQMLAEKDQGDQGDTQEETGDTLATQAAGSLSLDCPDPGAGGSMDLFEETRMEPGEEKMDPIENSDEESEQPDLKPASISSKKSKDKRKKKGKKASK